MTESASKRYTNAWHKLDDFRTALTRLDEVMGSESKMPDLVRDASIQRFEFCYELCWKSMRALLKVLGTDVNYPREAFREAYVAKWIPDEETFIRMMEDRNLMSHTYSEFRADEVMQRIPGYWLAMDASQKNLCRALEKFNPQKSS